MLPSLEKRRPWLAVLIAVAIFALAAGSRIFFLDSLGTRIPYVTFFPAVMIATLCGGLYAGATVTILSACFAAYFLIEPLSNFSIRDQVDWIGIAIFLVSGFMAAWLSESTRRAQRRTNLAETQAKLAAEREQATAALHESEARFRCYVENSPVAVFVVDREGHYVDFNEAATQLLGYPADTLSRMQILEVHPIEEHEALLREFTLLQDTGRMDLETRLLRSDGRTVWVSLRAVRLDGGNALAYCQDISASKGALQSVTETKLRLELAAKSGGLGVWEWNIAAGTVDWNDRMCELYGISRDAFDGTIETWSRALHAEDRQRAWEAGEAALRGDKEYSSEEFRVVHPDGKVLTIKSDAIVMRDGEGNAVRMIGLNRDITEQRYLEAQLLQAQKMEAIGRLAGGVAHDFNNSLSVILGYAELSRMVPADAEKFHEYVDEIVKAAEHSRDTTQQLLAFSRNEIVTPGRIDLNQLIRHTEKTLLHMFGADVHLRLITPDALWPVLMDPVQVNQIIMNLALNARDAMPDGGTLSIETRNVSINQSRTATDAEALPGDYVQMTVSDTGIGMDRQLQGRAFEPFFTTKEVGSGTGLGLATVYGIMCQNGGFVKLYSEPGRGASFSLFFPRLMQETNEDAPPPLAEFSGTGCLLLVEDEECVRRMVQLMLERAGYRVLVAESPRDALDICRANQGRIDCLLTDVIMPELNGVELSAAARAISPRIGIVYMSGYSADIIAHHGVLEHGVTFIQKPFDLTSLTEKIEMAMAFSRSR